MHQTIITIRLYKNLINQDKSNSLSNPNENNFHENSNKIMIVMCPIVRL